MHLPRAVARVSQAVVGGTCTCGSRADRLGGRARRTRRQCRAAQRAPAAHSRAPSAPSRLKARADANAIHLRWRAPARGRAMRYRIERGGRPIARVDRTRRSFTDRRVGPGRTYRYRVRALGRAGARCARRAPCGSRSRGPPRRPRARARRPSPRSSRRPAASRRRPTCRVAPRVRRRLRDADPDVPWPGVRGDVVGVPSGSTDTSGSVGRPAAEQGHDDCARKLQRRRWRARAQPAQRGRHAVRRGADPAVARLGRGRRLDADRQLYGR